MNIGWAKNIKSILEYYELTTNLQVIKSMPRHEWLRKVKSAIETKHIERLKEKCFQIVDGISVPKTKTSSISQIITTDAYRRQPQSTILKTFKHETRTIIIARYGLLECGRNYKGTMNEMCNQCFTIDDEDHRLNHCPKWRNLNLFDTDEKVDFRDIYADDLSIIRKVIVHIEKIWNTQNANGSMHT